MGVATLKTSRLADALLADGPNPEHADALMLFGQFVGEWDFDWVGLTWSGPINRARRTFVARRSGDEIVQEGHTEDGDPMRWIFSEITEDAFHWRSVCSKDGEKTWQLREEMHVHRRQG